MSEKNETPVSSEALAAALHFALLKEGQGDYSMAASAFQALLLIEPSNPYFHAMLGSLHQRQGNSDGAVREYTEAIKIYPSDVDSLTNLGEILLKAGRREEAIQHLKQAVELDTEGNHPAANRAKLLLGGT